MLRTVKFFVGLLVGAFAAQQASAFSMWGPAESWQTATLNYGYDGDLGGPKNLGEEYRLNTPIITYGYDHSFLDYFGNEGVKAVDAAMRMMNSLPPVSKMSHDLSEYPTEGNLRVNQRAQALYLVDVKSTMLNLLVEHMGLCGERHVFDLYSRIPPPGAPACEFEYTVLNWNFDPITWEPTHYVNGIQYTYEIVDDCPARAVADAVEYTVDGEKLAGTAVATVDSLFGYGAGGYFLGLTRDDVGGLRYIYRRGNYNNEVLPPDAISSTVANGSAWSIPNFGLTNNANGNGTTGNTTSPTNQAALRGGIEKVTFVKMQSDSVIGMSWRPTIVNYTVPTVVNSKWVDQKVRRVLLQPDIIIAAADMTPATPLNVGMMLVRSWGYAAPTNNSTGLTTGNTGNGGGTNGLISLTGPGTFIPQMYVTFNKIGQYSYSTGFANNNYFLTESTGIYGYTWGSFDGSTNAPVVYPSGNSIRALEDQVLNSPLATGQQSLGNPITFNPVYSGVITNADNTTGNGGQ